MKRYFTYFLFCFAILLGFSFVSEAQSHSLKTVVIDPGHGGKDPGAVSSDKKTREKDLALAISKKLGDKIKAHYKDEVNVLYTRSTDVFITLQGRPDFANRNHADLFISVHINAVKNNSKASGHSVHVLGQSSIPDRDLIAGNLEVCKRENSVILLEDDYSTKYQDFDPSDDASYIFMTLMQSAFYEQSIYFASLVEKQLEKGPIKVRRGVSQDPFYVLWKTAMPSVLLELGFITNDGDLAVFRSDAQLDVLAQRIFDAFVQYKKHYDESMKL